MDAKHYHEFDAVYDLLTVHEVSEMWGKHRNTIYEAMGTRCKPLVFRQSDAGYLITRDSCVRRWGKPLRECDDLHRVDR